MNEDCMNLNLWTPACDEQKRPVMVWLHGGGYESGSAIEHIAYEGENMSRFGDVVTISINHRLNIIGYFDLSEFGDEYMNSGNAGGDDIIAALKWIQENVEKFGGDPDNVIIFGQSGGGGKVTTLLQSPGADGLYAKGYSMSGVLDVERPTEEESGKALAESIMAELSVSKVKELEEVPYQRLADAYLKVRPDFAKENRYVGDLPFRNEFYAGRKPLIFPCWWDPCSVRWLLLFREMRIKRKCQRKRKSGLWKKCLVLKLLRSLFPCLRKHILKDISAIL